MLKLDAEQLIQGLLVRFRLLISTCCSVPEQEAESLIAPSVCREKCQLVCTKARLINLMQFNVKTDRTRDHSIPWYENLWLSYYVICLFMVLNSNHIPKY